MEVDISGAKVFFTTPIDVPLLGELQISETLIVSWIVMALITGICFWLTRGLKVRNISKKQAASVSLRWRRSIIILNCADGQRPGL